MKNSKLFLLSMLLMAFGCNPKADKKENSTEKQVPESSAGIQVKIGKVDVAALSITYSAISTLENELKTYWGLATLANLRIEHEGGEFWLKGDGNLSSGGHIDWALILDNQSDDLFLVINGGSQSCTSRECCSSCKLITVSNVEGHCDCLVFNESDSCVETEYEHQKTCGHSVTSGLSTDQAYLDLLNNLN